MAATKVSAPRSRQNGEAASTETADSRLRGMVEISDANGRIQGWASDLENPAATLSVELLIGEETVASVVADHPRADMASASGNGAKVGFAFADAAIEQLCEMVEMGHDGPLSVRIAGTDSILPAQNSLGNAIDFFAARRRARSSSGSAIDMMARLSSLQRDAESLAEGKIRVQSDQLIGFIEQLSIDDNGLVWIAGWMRGAVATELPVVIADGQKIAGGMALTMFKRDDLGDEARGIIGVLRSDWRPRPTGELIIVLGDGSYLQNVASPKIVSKYEFADHFNYRWPNCHIGNSAALRHLMDHAESWQPTGELSGTRVRAAIEEIYVLPSFGCLVTGWALSPLKAITSLGMRFGSSILALDERSLSFRDRPDLAHAAFGCDMLTGEAGFVAVFRGNIAASDIGVATLKIILSDETAANQAVDANAIRRLGVAASVEQLLHLYPSITAEPFFADLALAFRKDVKSRAEHAIPVDVRKCTNAIIIALPEERSDIFAVFDEISQRMSALPGEVGLVFLSSRGPGRATAMKLYREFADRAPGQGSLFVVPDVVHAAYALPEILIATGAQHFAFLAAGILPTDLGWRTAAEANDCPAILATTDLAQHGQTTPVPLAAFAWRRDAFMKWLRAAPPFIGGNGEYSDFANRSDAMLVRDGAWFLRPRKLGLLQEAMNRAGAIA